MISPVRSTNYNLNKIFTCRRPDTPCLKNNYPGYIEQSVRMIEFPCRKIVNRVFDIFRKKKYDSLCKKFIETDENSPEYIKFLINIGKIFTPNRIVDINLADGRIDKIAKSGKPHIFVMNHCNQTKDPKMLAGLNSILNTKYYENEMSATCPRTRIILNEDIINSMPEKTQKLFLKFGAIPIDAGIFSPDKKKNVKQFIPLMRDFIKGKVNIFIFPEGKKAVFKRPPEEKFQLGVAEIVTKLADKMEEVNVTPVSFAYGSRFKHCGDSMYIGETITFKKEGDSISATVGNLTSKYTDPDYVKFFNGRNNAVLTNNGEPLTIRESAAYVGGIICENMKVCTEYAKANLPLKKSTDEIINA